METKKFGPYDHLQVRSYLPHRYPFLFVDKILSVDVPMSAKKIQTRLARYDNAIAGIQQHRFPASPDPHHCPVCPFFFICPAAEDRGGPA